MLGKLESWRKINSRFFFEGSGGKVILLCISIGDADTESRGTLMMKFGGPINTGENGLCKRKG